MVSHQEVLTLALIVVLLALPSLIYGITLHVRPTSTNTSCPTHPCQTLSEYAQDPGQYFNDSNLTLQLLQGTHTLNVNLTIRNITQFKIHGAVPPTRVVCDSRVGFTFYNIHRMSIHGLAFVACASGSVNHIITYSVDTYYGLHLQSVQMAEIIDCTFQDSYGSALGVVDSHVVLRDNNFLNNCRLCLNGRCDGYWWSAYQGTKCFGGGVFARRSNLSITGSSSFSGNSASDGGGVSAWGSSNVYISGNTTFSGNSANDGGGVSAQYRSNVYISGNTTFSGNSASYGNGGGVSARASSYVDISGNTTFSVNAASYGGGVSAWHGSNVNISGNTNFSGNSASYDGGGVSASDRGNVYISGNTTFIGNSASDGGALSVLCNNVYISGNVMFSSNSARIGGCVFVHDNCLYTSTTSLNLDGKCSFTNCSATNDGGAIHASGIQLNLSGNNVFDANRAEHFGGGLYAPKSSLNFNGDNTFTANWAGSRGGGIYAQETNISFSGTGLLSGNKAQLDGGGIYADGSNLNFSANITISSNTAQLGGGIYSDNNTTRNTHAQSMPRAEEYPEICK